MKILSIDNQKIIIQAERFESRRLTINDPELVMEIGSALLISVLGFSLISFGTNPADFSSLLNIYFCVGVSVPLIFVFNLVDRLFYTQPKLGISTVYEVTTEDRTLLRQFKGLWYSENPGVSKIIELGNIQSIGLVYDANADLKWDGEANMDIMETPHFSYQVIVISGAGESSILEKNSIQTVNSHPVALAAFDRLIEETKKSVRVVEKFLREIKAS
jgi:hypothetical protein